MTGPFDIAATRKQLEAKRRRHGYDTPIGHRCSNMIERLDIYPTLYSGHKKRMEEEITKGVADLARLTTKGN